MSRNIGGQATPGGEGQDNLFRKPNPRQTEKHHIKQYSNTPVAGCPHNIEIAWRPHQSLLPTTQTSISSQQTYFYNASNVQIVVLAEMPSF